MSYVVRPPYDLRRAARRLERQGPREPSLVRLMKLMWAYVLAAQPTSQMLTMSSFGVVVTDRDLALLVAIICGMALPRKRLARTFSYRAFRWFAVYVAIRGGVAFVAHGKHGVFVDIHYLPYLLLLPGVTAYCQIYGWRAMARFLFRVSYVMSAIGVVLYAAVLAHLLHHDLHSVLGVVSLSPKLSRPGGEVLVPVAVAATPLRRVVSSRREFRFGSLVLLLELLCSQTLTLLIGCGIGLVFFIFISLVRGHGTNLRPMLIKAALVLAVGLGLLAAALPTTFGNVTARFNVGERVTSLSANYRQLEQNATSEEWLHGSLSDKLVGPGPGSVVTFTIPQDGEVVTSNDTHNSFYTVGLKGGLVGELFYLSVLLGLIAESLRLGSVLEGTSVAAGVIALASTSYATPFLTVLPGWALLVMLIGISSARRSESSTC